MVLESIIDPLKAEKTPRDMFWVGLTFPSIGLFLAYITFGPYASLATIFLTSMPLIVIMYKTLQLEERKDEDVSHLSLQGKHYDGFNKETFLIKEHGKALSFFVALFLGMIVSFTFWYIVLPVDMSENLFSFQLSEIQRIKSSSIGDIVRFDEISFNQLLMILANNFRVLFFCILFSFVYGSGAIFILTLNASVVGIAIGSTIERALRDYAPLGLFDFLYNYFGSFSISFCYLIHGIPEVSAYFLGALGGGIISVAVARHEYRSPEWMDIVTDSVDLIILSAFVLLLGGVIEVFITPMICSV